MGKENAKITIEVLVEGTGGELVFKPVEVWPGNLRELIETTKNPVVRQSIEKAAKEKKVKI